MKIEPEKCTACSKSFGIDEKGPYVILPRTGSKREYISEEAQRHFWGALTSCSNPDDGGQSLRIGCRAKRFI